MAVRSFPTLAWMDGTASVATIEGSDKWGTLEQRVKWIVETVIRGCELLVFGAIEAMVSVALVCDLVFTYSLYGIVLLIVRGILLWLCPPLSKASQLIADIIDAILKVNGRCVAAKSPS